MVLALRTLFISTTCTSLNLNTNLIYITNKSRASFFCSNNSNCTSALDCARSSDCGISMVQGAPRGIGLEFVRQLLEKQEKEYSFLKIGRENYSLQGQAITKIKQREKVLVASAKSVQERYCSLNLLINAAGVLSLTSILQPDGRGCGTERDVVVVANLSSRVGSIGDNLLGGWHSYQYLKNALNQCRFFYLKISLSFIITCSFAF
ncbi:hypothetical protein MKX01_010774 [Papaver californicum]|nr:hypothetical protein MKX01_010774 [Papaver californicum]